MYRDTWTNCYSSICSISFFNQLNQKIGSGTGFKVNNFLVTNNHVFQASGASSVELRFVNIDGNSTKFSKILSYQEFQGRLQTGMPEHSWDFAILSLNDTEFSTIPSLTLSDSSKIQIGGKIAVLGFQFDQTNLSIKQGLLSSKYTKAGVKYMQIDASVNHGNSGGPLINVDNNRVVGIVTRKHTGLTNAFDDLIKTFDNNIKVLNVAKGMMSMSGVDPVEALIVSQNQMKITSKEIQRSSNVGIGLAYELDQIKDFFDHL
ncbi:serine protease [Rufibacter sediminis]|uniref:Trypsin-like peptidase domain-containing protein n=1 Tax=Rufibacter sediminis TaxID=2762756 RepID=A0ABR6VQB6_9BACT|nr:serine protease [Rufibacter sediminis]MBC3539048.1 trypsin-like peptidase domain-containing protein [Rufibacter sediminis]